MPNVPSGVDHLTYAVPDLDAGISDIERRLGVRPAVGGRHANYGTRNALVALGPQAYLEIIAPDLDLPRPERGRLFGLDDLERPGLVTWVLRHESIEELAERARSQGLELGAVESGRREGPDGTVLSWKLTDPYAMPMDGAVPFLIAWGTTPHPAGNAPAGGELVGLRIEHPTPARVREALNALGVEMTVEEGPRMQLVATVETGTGQVEIR